MAVARPMTAAERHAYFARVFAGDLPRRVRLAAQLRADDAAHPNPASGGNLNDVPSTALLRVLVGQIRRTVLTVIVVGIGEVVGMFLGQWESGMLPASLNRVADLGLLLITVVIVYLWFDRRRWSLLLIFLTACCHGFFIASR